MMRFQKTLYTLVFSLLIGGSFGQIKIEKNSTDIGHKDYVAKECVVFKPGYHFKGSSSQEMRARVDERLKTNTSYLGNSPSTDISSPINMSLPVAETSGSLDVSNTGAALYSIPIFTPKGTAGMEPKISLVYNSQGGYGVAGRGWNISGISAITRVTKSKYFDGTTGPMNLDWNDNYVLDGQRLINKSPGEFVTEVESYSKINWYSSYKNGPDYWEVKTKDGLTMEFGRTSDSKVVTIPSDQVYSWNINKITDNYGNYIIFKYDNGFRNEGRITSIEYTGNSDVAPYNKIEFFYTEREDSRKVYMAGNSISLSALLFKIKVTTEGSTIREYKLEHTQNIETYLSKITEVADGQVLNPTTFTYGTDITQPVASEIESISGNYSFLKWQSRKSEPVILNGQWSSEEQYIVYSGFKYSGSNYTFPFPVHQITSPTLRIPADFNNDGLEDLMFFSKNNASAIIYEGDRLNQYPIPVEISGIQDGFSYDLHGKFFADMDNDGVSEIIVCRPYVQEIDIYKVTKGINKYYITYNKSIPLLSTSPYSGVITPFSTQYKFDLLDMNGDGKLELLYIVREKSYFFSLDYQNGTSNVILHAGWPTIWHDFKIGDFNGDGLDDILSASNDHKNYKISYSIGNDYIHSDLIELNTTHSTNKKYPSVESMDLNGDGFTDIIHRYLDNNETNTFFDVYFMTGDKFTKRSYSYPKRLTGLQGVYDSNVDGVLELVFSGYVFGNSTVLSFANHEAKFMNQVTSAIKGKTNIYYDFEPNLTHIHNRRTEIPSQLVSNFTRSIAMVDRVRNDAINLYNTYVFSDPIYDNEKKSLIGYLKFVNRNHNLDLSETTYYKFDNSKRILLPEEKRIALGHTLNNNLKPISTEKYTYSIVNGVSKSYSINPTNTEIIDYLGNTSSKIERRFDLNGNMNFEKVTTGDYVKESTGITFGQFGAHIPNLATKTEVKYYKASAPAISESFVTENTFNTKGKLTNQFALPKNTSGLTSVRKVEKVWGYDPKFGNNISETTKPSDSPEITSSITYDSKGRNVVSTTNELGQTGYMEYEKRFSKPSKVTFINGQFETYIYDELGKVVEKTDVLGLKTNFSYQWDIQNNGEEVKKPLRTVFKVNSKSDGEPESTVWYDQAGREVMSRTMGLYENHFVVTKYDNIGRKLSETDPFFESSTEVLKTESRYDEFSRLIESKKGNLISKVSFEVLTTGLKTTSTGTEGVMKYTETDKSGKMVKSGGDQPEVLTHDYDHIGRNITVKLDGKEITKITYDIYGNQIELSDLSAGATKYGHDALGRLIEETDAKGNKHTMVYDKMNKILENTGPEGKTTYSYNSFGVAINQLISETAFNGVIRSNIYDNLGRIKEEQLTVDGEVLSTKYEFDNLSRVLNTIYPGNYTKTYIYDGNGNLISVKGNDKIIWYNPNRDQRGNYTTYLHGNGTRVFNSYDSFGRILSHSATKTLFTPRDNQVTNFGGYNLTYASDVNRIITKNNSSGAHDYKESYTFDKLNRLANIALVNQLSNVASTPFSINYAGNGNISSKTGVGTFNYANNTSNAVTSLTQLQSSDLATLPEQTIEYTPFDRTGKIIQNGKSLVITYDGSYDRVKSEWYNGTQLYRKRIYNGNHERNTENGITHNIYYIDAPDGLCAIYEHNGTLGTLHYVTTDYRGNIERVISEAGSIEYNLDYDAWGRERNPITLTYVINDTHRPRWLYRGYTGHEMLPEFGLINMNNRMYDPLLGRMLAVDNFVADATCTQAYNRYTYANNNPVAYVDPNGELPLPLGYLLFGTDVGYDFQKFVSPVAVKIDLGFGSHNRGVGIRASIGIPQSYIFSYRIERGIGYWSRNGQVESGFQKTSGYEYGITSFFIVGSLNYDSPGEEMDQKVFHMTIGVPGLNIKYENDYAFGLPFGDSGDRYRSAAQRITIGSLAFSTRMFTGDPGLDAKDRKHYDGGDGYSYYEENKEYREGVFSVSFLGLVHVGRDSEATRHRIQNKLVHDNLSSDLGTVNGKTARFKVLNISRKSYWQIGSTGGGYLY